MKKLIDVKKVKSAKRNDSIAELYTKAAKQFRMKRENITLYDVPER